MYTIKTPVIDKMIEHANEELPNEACGYLVGKNKEIINMYKMTNIDHSPDHFSFAPEEQFAALKQSRQEGVDLIGIYHSHPSTPARMSDEDIKLAFDRNIIYVIVSLMGNKIDIKAFGFENEKIIPIELLKDRKQ